MEPHSERTCRRVRGALRGRHRHPWIFGGVLFLLLLAGLGVPTTTAQSACGSDCWREFRTCSFFAFTDAERDACAQEYRACTGRCSVPPTDGVDPLPPLVVDFGPVPVGVSVTTSVEVLAHECKRGGRHCGLRYTWEPADPSRIYGAPSQGPFTLAGKSEWNLPRAKSQTVALLLRFAPTNVGRASATLHQFRVAESKLDEVDRREITVVGTGVDGLAGSLYLLLSRYQPVLPRRSGRAYSKPALTSGGGAGW